MPLVLVALAVVLLLVLMTKFKLNGFISLFIVALLVGIASGMSLSDVYESMVEGVGGQLGELILTLGFGAMLGKVLADSGAAQRIATTMVNFFGISRVQLAMVLTAFAVGITMFYEVGFVLLIPIVFTIVREYKLPLLWVGLPMSISLSTMHSFLPPHPGPAAVSATFGASQGVTLFYGLFIALPAAALIAFTWPRLPFIKRMNPQVPYALITTQEFEERDMPSFRTCLVSNKVHAENLVGHLSCFIRTRCEFHAAAFTASAGMDLRLDHDPAAQFTSCVNRLIDGFRHFAARHRYPVFGQ